MWLCPRIEAWLGWTAQERRCGRSGMVRAFWAQVEVEYNRQKEQPELCVEVLR